MNLKSRWRKNKLQTKIKTLNLMFQTHINRNWDRNREKSNVSNTNRNWHRNREMSKKEEKHFSTTQTNCGNQWCQSQLRKEATTTTEFDTTRNLLFTYRFLHMDPCLYVKWALHTNFTYGSRSVCKVSITYESKSICKVGITYGFLHTDPDPYVKWSLHTDFYIQIHICM